MLSRLCVETYLLAVGELPKHTPSFAYKGRPLVLYGKRAEITDGFASGDHWRSANATTQDPFNSIGNDQYHNNVSACIAAYVWKRTA